MRTAIFVITQHGIEIANKISKQLEGCTIYIKDKDFKKLREVVDDNCLTL